jgi:hypothetical protein
MREEHMRLLLYTPVSEGAGEQLQKMIKELVSENNVEIYRSIESLAHRLRQPTNDLPIAVLHAASREDLSDIVSIRGLLRDVRIILVLPDRDENTIAQGHTLRPRFLSYTDSDFANISAVLEKWLESYATKV